MATVERERKSRKDVDDDGMKPKRVYKRMTDRRILAMLRNGMLRVDLETGDIWSVVPGREPHLITPVPDSKNKYLFVNVYYKGARKKIAVHRVVWMKGHDRLVPAGCDIHHDDDNRNHNWLNNLVAEDLHEHRSEAGKKGAAVTNGFYPASWDELEGDEDCEDVDVDEGGCSDDSEFD